MGAAKFRRPQRLCGAEAFRRLFKEGSHLRVSWGPLSEGELGLIALPNGLPYPRFGCAVRRKAASTAAARNRLKRWLREVFRRNQAFFPKSSDLVAVIFQVPRNPSFQLLEKALLTLASPRESSS